MASTGHLYGLAFKSAFNKQIDFDTDTIKVMMCTSTYAPNYDTHQYKSDVTNEVTGTGYTAGGATLAGAAVSYDATTHTFKMTGTNPTWATSTITARYAIFYDAATGVDATSPLICCIDFGVDISTSASLFTVVIPTAGLVNLVAN